MTPTQASTAPPDHHQMNNNSNTRTLEDQVLCPICLEVFCDPVTTTCGHSFCMSCLQNFWDHQVNAGEMLYCPQCRENFPCRPRLAKNVILEEMVACFTQAKGKIVGALWDLTGPNDVPCDFCSHKKLKSVKSCLQCMASLCENHLSSHYSDQVFQDHQLLEPVLDLKERLCRKHRKLKQFYCRTEGFCVCGICLLEEHENHDTIALEEERAHKEVEVRKILANVENQILIINSDRQKHRGQVLVLSKLIQTTRKEVNTCFSEIIQEVKQLQLKVLDFVEKEEAAALEKLGGSIQQSHSRLLKLEGDSIWLRTLLNNPSDQQFMQEFPRLKHLPVCVEPLPSTNFEEKQNFLQLSDTLADFRTRLVDVGLNFINQLLLKGDRVSWKPISLSGRMLSCENVHSKVPPPSPGIKMSCYEVLPLTVDRKTLLQYYCNLRFDPTMASEELFLFKETHSVLNLGILLEPCPFPGFKLWPQVLCSQSLSEGLHYWEVEVSNSWVCLGVTYSRSPQPNSRQRRNVVYLLGRNPYSWCLEWDSLKFSVWHNNTQTVLHGGYHRTLGVALDCQAGCLSFYGVASGVSLLYRFLACFREPLYPAVMVGSGASVTLKQRPEP